MGFLDSLFAGGLGGSIGGLVQGLTSIGSAKRQAKYQRSLMTYQDQLQDENYARELADKERLIAEDREYNSIGAQMQRARDAGVSPLAALGVSSGNSISASAPASGDISIPSAVPDSLQQVGQGLASAVEGSISGAVQAAQLRGQQLHNEYEQQTMAYRVELQKHTTAAAEINKRLLEGQIELTEQERKVAENQGRYIQLLADRQEQLTPLEVKNLQAEYDKIMAETTELDIRNEQLREYMDAQIMQLNAATWAALQQGALAREQSKVVSYDARTRRMSAENQAEANAIQERYVELQEKAQKAEQEYKEALVELEQGKLEQRVVEERRRFWLDASKEFVDACFRGVSAWTTMGVSEAYIAGQKAKMNPFVTPKMELENPIPVDINGRPLW